MNDVIRWGIALVVVAHGAGHILFMPLLYGTLRLDASGHSWLLTPVLGDGAVRLLAAIAAGLALAIFVGVGAGIVLQAGWWRPLAIAGAAVSSVLVVVMWDGLQTSPAAAALACDVAVVVALLVVRWPTQELIGS